MTRLELGAMAALEARILACQAEPLSQAELPADRRTHFALIPVGGSLFVKLKLLFRT